VFLFQALAIVGGRDGSNASSWKGCYLGQLLYAGEWITMGGVVYFVGVEQYYLVTSFQVK
jgi:hypothetical protein